MKISVSLEETPIKSIRTYCPTELATGIIRSAKIITAKGTHVFKQKSERRLDKPDEFMEK
jgi:hypothetical protein